MLVQRWGQSAYETDADLALEAAAAQALGLRFAVHADVRSQPDFSEADVLVVTSKVRVDADVLDRMRGRLIIATTSGVDHVDLDACRAAGKVLVRSPLARRDAVVEHSLGMALYLRRRMAEMHAAAQRGVWCRKDLPMLAPGLLRDQPVGLIGLGVIGTRMAEVLQALGAEVLGHDPAVTVPGVQSVSLSELLQRSALVSVHCSLTERSRGLLGAEELSLMRPDAVLLNTARGESLDVSAAVRAVKEGRLGGLGVDVFPVEPYPLLAKEAVDRVLFAPHAAGYAPDLGTRVARSVASALQAWVDGTALPYPVVQ